MIVGQIVGGKKLDLDLPKLVDTRLLIQANSGGGKSWLLRLIAERAGIQTIVLDNEGEFASLRERWMSFWSARAVSCLPIRATPHCPHAGCWNFGGDRPLGAEAFRSAALRKAISRIAYSPSTRSLAADSSDPR
jgi:hypothetical protein